MTKHAGRNFPATLLKSGFRNKYLKKWTTVFYQVYCTLLYIENDDEILPVHYTWKVAEKGLKMAFMMNNLAMMNSCEIILEK